MMVQTTKISAGPILKHPDDDRLYYADFQAELSPDELIEDVTAVDVEDGTGAPLADLVVDSLSLTPNPVIFKNSQNRDVPIGKAALFRASGGLEDVDYYAQVKIVTDLPNEISRVVIFSVRGR